MINLTLFAQLLMYLPRNIIESEAPKYDGKSPNGHFSTKSHLIVLIAAQMKQWSSLREIETGFLTNGTKLYHLGIKKAPKRSTLSDANTNRDSKIFEEIFYALLKTTQQRATHAKKLLVKKDLNIFDSTIITVSLELFKWAKFRREGGFKIHTMFNVQSQSPIFADITHGNVNDVSGIDTELEKYANSIMVFDRGYSSFKLFSDLSKAQVVFVTRLKSSVAYDVLTTKEINKSGVLKDEIIKFTGDKVRRNFKGTLRLVSYKDEKLGKNFHFLTNEFNYSPKTVAYLYKKRWEIELFFKWLKQNLIIKKYLGYSENAVKVQVWSCLISYLLLVYVKESIHFEGSMIEFSRIVRELLFKEIGLIDLVNREFRSQEKQERLDESLVSLFEDFI